MKKTRLFVLLGLLVVSTTVLCIQKGFFYSDEALTTSVLCTQKGFCYSDEAPTTFECENDVFCGTPDELSEAVKTAIGAKPTGSLLVASEVAEAIEKCDNGIDDDYDDTIDCADDDCKNGTACGSGKQCLNKQCIAPVIAENCSNGVDDNGDLKVDCSDTGCSEGTSCASGKTCQGGACKDIPQIVAKKVEPSDNKTVAKDTAQPETVTSLKDTVGAESRDAASDMPTDQESDVQDSETEAPVIALSKLLTLSVEDQRSEVYAKKTSDQALAKVEAQQVLFTQAEEKIGVKKIQALFTSTTTPDGLTEKDQDLTVKELTLDEDEKLEVIEQTIDLSEQLTATISNEELTNIAEEKYGIKLTTSYADSDNDGISDAVEIKAGSDPRSADSDGDGKTDAEELSLGTDPAQETDFDLVLKKPAVTNISEDRMFVSSQPPIRGRALPGSIVTVKFIGQDGSIQIKKVKTDASGLYTVTPDALVNGSYQLKVETHDVEGNLVEESDIAILNIDTNQKGSTLVLQFPKSTEVQGNIDLQGTVEPGALLEAQWQSVVMTSTILADSETGEFKLVSPKGLGVGEHELTVYGVKDSIVGKETKFKFNIVSEALAASAATEKRSAPAEAEANFLSKNKLLVSGGIALFAIIAIAVVLIRKKQ